MLGHGKIKRRLISHRGGGGAAEQVALRLLALVVPLVFAGESPERVGGALPGVVLLDEPLGDLRRRKASRKRWRMAETSM